MTEGTNTGSDLPTVKLTATAFGTVLAAAITRWAQGRYGWEFSTATLDLIGLLIGALIGYIVPEANPSRSGVQMMRRHNQP